MIRVVLPSPLRVLAQVGTEVTVQVPSSVTQRAVLDALEAAYPMLRGTMRDHVTHRRRAFIRFFADKRDLSYDEPDAALPPSVADGREPLLIVGDGRRLAASDTTHAGGARRRDAALVLPLPSAPERAT
jgi:sulfur-carrier protein